MLTKIYRIITFALLLSFAAAQVKSQTVDMTGPVGSGSYGASVTVLTNGNYVVTDPSYSESGISNIGAVYLYDGSSHALISTLKGSTSNDGIGFGIVLLNNGNFVVRSPYWSNGSASSAGAVTWCNGSTGLNGTISSSNSLVGSTANDRVGFFVINKLANGNYVVPSPYWSNGSAANVGAATWCNGNSGLTGTISSSNSLIGTTAGDMVGQVTPLSNGNYIVSSQDWHNGLVAAAGEATWCNGATGLTGIVNTTNSFFGTSSNGIGGRVLPLSNGNYLILGGGGGIVTWANGSTGLTGSVNGTNSWIATSPTDMVIDAVVLQNGNYLVTGSINGQMSVTWANGVTGAISLRTPSNSFLEGLNVVPLANGAYVLSNPFWNANRGAAILCQADGTTIGTFNNSNSLVGTNPNDLIGSAGITPLANNNFVVGSPDWNGKVGAATLCKSDGTTVGSVNSNNSLVGTNVNDSVGCGDGVFQGGGATALTNGNYVVNSPKWNNSRGAITWGDGFVGSFGQINSSNSLIGANAGDRVGVGGMFSQIIPFTGDTTFYFRGVVALGNGNYVAAAVGWNGNNGATYWGDGKRGTSGIVNNRNSLVGVTNMGAGGNLLLANVIPTFTNSPTIYDAGTLYYHFYENIGSNQWGKGTENVSFRNLSNNYIIQGIEGISNKATITWGNGNGGSKGSTSTCNTVYGSVFNGVNNMTYVFDSIYNYLLVGRPADNIVSRYYPALGAASPSGNDNSSSTVSGNSTFVFPTTTGCGQIAALTPSGTSPVSGSVTAKTWLENPQPKNFVARHYEITPAINPSTSTGTVTLYFTQSDFDGFNNQSPAPAIKLPTGPSDAVGIANLLVQKEGGVSNVGTGLPGSYPGPITTIDPADGNIVWNTSLDRWEVSFDVTGFSGFFIKTTALTALPLRLLNFSGKPQANGNQLQWKTSNEINTKTFVLQSSADGRSFQYSGTVLANGGGHYSFDDTHALANLTYYRLQIIDVDGRFTYSNIIWISSVENSAVSLYPNPVIQSATLNIGNRNGLIGAQAQLTDASGKLLQLYRINNTQQQLDMVNFRAGLYFLKLGDGSVIKILKQ